MGLGLAGVGIIRGVFESYENWWAEPRSYEKAQRFVSASNENILSLAEGQRFDLIPSLIRDPRRFEAIKIVDAYEGIYTKKDKRDEDLWRDFVMGQLVLIGGALLAHRTSIRLEESSQTSAESPRTYNEPSPTSGLPLL